MNESIDRRSSLSPKGCLLFLLISIMGVFLCMVTVYAGVEYSCQRDATQWLVDYPGSELVEEEYSWLRPFGIGRTVRTLYSIDARTDVNRWYSQYRLELDREGKVLNDGFATMRWQIANASDGEGTSIRLSSECALDLVLW